MTLGSAWRLLRTSAENWINDRATELAAALSFYMIFAMAPMVTLLVAIMGFVLGERAARGELESRIAELVGPEGATVVQTIIANAGRRGGGGVASTVISTAILIVGATGVLAQLKTSLNRVWDVEPKPGRSIRNLIRTRLLSLLLVVLVAVLLMASLAVSAVLSGVTQWLEQRAGVPSSAAGWMNFLVTLAVLTGLFAAVYKWLPDVRIRWKEVWVGALITALLFSVGKSLIGMYLGRAAPGSVYGAAGALAAVLIWIYYTSLVVLFGAEMTQVYASMFGEGIRPSAYAIRAGGTGKPALRGEGPARAAG